MQFEILKFSISNSFLTAVRKNIFCFFIILTNFGSARLLSLLTANVVQNFYFSIRISHPMLVPLRTSDDVTHAQKMSFTRRPESH